MRRGLIALVLIASLSVTAACTETVSNPGPSPSTTESAEVPNTNGDSSSAGEGNADVTYVKATQAEDGTWTFAVTVQHPDTGWEDYADGWDVVTPDGEVLKADTGDMFTRLLAHPHIDEQPFTRSQPGIVVPDGVTVVVVRAHDIVDGFGGREIAVDLEATSGEGFEVLR